MTVKDPEQKAGIKIVTPKPPDFRPDTVFEWQTIVMLAADIRILTFEQYFDYIHIANWSASAIDVSLGQGADITKYFHIVQNRRLKIPYQNAITINNTGGGTATFVLALTRNVDFILGA